MISVIVCTHNRPDSVRRCLEALARVKTGHKWEVVAVANASPQSERYLLDLSKILSSSISLKVLSEPTKGVCLARNKGAAASIGDIIAFVDDDCYVDPGFIDAVHNAFSEYPRVGFVTGRIRLFDPNDAPITINESESLACFPPYSFIPAGAAQGANLSFRREVFNSIGGFDTRFGHDTLIAEDIVAAATILWNGLPGIYDPRVVVFHHHQRRQKKEISALLKSYDVGRGGYYCMFILRRDLRAVYLRSIAQMIFRFSWKSRYRPKDQIVLARVLAREMSGALKFLGLRRQKQDLPTVLGTADIDMTLGLSDLSAKADRDARRRLP